jgi:hypothetical protein
MYRIKTDEDGAYSNKINEIILSELLLLLKRVDETTILMAELKKVIKENIQLNHFRIITALGALKN